LRIRGTMPVRVHMDDMGRMVNRKTKTDKTKTDTNPIPDPNRYWRHCSDPNSNYKLRLRPVLSILPIKGSDSMQMSMRKLNLHTILQNYLLWCCCHVMYKLQYPSIRVRTAPPLSVRVRVRVSVSYGVTLLRILFCMCPKRFP